MHNDVPNNTNDNSNNSNVELKGSYASEEDATFIQNEHADAISRLAKTTDTLNECKIKNAVLEERSHKTQKDNTTKKQEYELITQDLRDNIKQSSIKFEDAIDKLIADIEDKNDCFKLLNNEINGRDDALSIT